MSSRAFCVSVHRIEYRHQMWRCALYVVHLFKSEILDGYSQAWCEVFTVMFCCKRHAYAIAPRAVNDKISRHNLIVTAYTVSSIDSRQCFVFKYAEMIITPNYQLSYKYTAIKYLHINAMLYIRQIMSWFSWDYVFAVIKMCDYGRTITHVQIFRFYLCVWNNRSDPHSQYT